MRIRSLSLVLMVAAGCGGAEPHGRQDPILSPNLTTPVWPELAGAGGAGAGNTGAGSAGSTDADAGRAALPGALADVQFTLDVKLPAGAERLECMYAAMPSDRGVIAVPSAESHYTPGSHHLLAYRTDLTSIPFDKPGIWDCTNDASWILHNRGSYYEAQQPDSHRELPPGVAHEFDPGEVILLQSHYVNTTDAEVQAHVELTLHTIEIARVTQEAGSIIFSNINIRIPAHAKWRVTMTCKLPQDIHPAELWSHMHKQAVSFVATSDDTTANPALGNTLYTELEWSEPQPRIYPRDPPITLHAGTNVTFSCDYANDTNKVISYGDSAQTNEMCIFHGMYWPRMAASAEQCRDGKMSAKSL